ncbi:MAG: hypothetical protein ACT4O6_06470 [Reyranella sp.]
MSQELSAEETARLRAELAVEIAKLADACRQAGAKYAARFLTERRAEVLEIAFRARTEPKKRDLPSPFIYSMQ